MSKYISMLVAVALLALFSVSAMAVDPVLPTVGVPVEDYVSAWITGITDPLKAVVAVIFGLFVVVFAIRFARSKIKA